MSRLAAFARGVWEFVIGDDWRTALGVALAISLTAIVCALGGAGWWVLPLAVLGLLILTIRRALGAAAGG